MHKLYFKTLTLILPHVLYEIYQITKWPSVLQSRTIISGCLVTMVPIATVHPCLVFKLIEFAYLNNPLIKVAWVVNLKLAFKDWFFYYLIILIKWCKIAYKTLDKALLFSRNTEFCLKNWKLWQAPTTIYFKYLLLKFCTGVWVFLFCLDLELFAKIKKDLISTHSLKPDLSITQDFNKMKKIPKTHS